MPQMLPGLAPLAEQYDAFIVDLWGTVHNGVAPLPGAVDCLERLQAAGKTVAFLSNVPRRVEQAHAVLAQIGIHRSLYNHLYSSGQETWDALLTRPDDWHRSFGRRTFYIGPDRHTDMVDEHPELEAVAELVEAEVVLCVGPQEPDKTTVEEHLPILSEAASRSLKMICANPDVVVIRAGSRVLCAGGLAQHYERELGGDVRWHGKPYPAVFERCQALLGEPDPARVLVVGDSLTTDIAGANAAGMPSALVFGGIHREAMGIGFGEMPTAGAADAIFEDVGETPSYGLPSLRWWPAALR